MSVILDEYTKAIDASTRDYVTMPLGPVLKWIVKDLCELREALDGAFARLDGRISEARARMEELSDRVDPFSSTDHGKRLDALEGANNIICGRLENLGNELRRVHERLCLTDGRFQGMDHRLTAQAAAVRRLEEFGGFGEVPGRALPRALPPWDSCVIYRTGNSVAVSAGPSRLTVDVVHPRPAMLYTFDDFEEAGRFVAAVLTQATPQLQGIQVSR